jgi:hypothetical protein
MIPVKGISAEVIQVTQACIAGSASKRCRTVTFGFPKSKVEHYLTSGERMGLPYPTSARTGDNGGTPPVVALFVLYYSKLNLSN